MVPPQLSRLAERWRYQVEKRSQQDPQDTGQGTSSPDRAYKTEIISTPIDGRTYRYGENIDIALTFNTDVYVPEDDSWIVIRVGDAADGPNSRVAAYLSGSDTNRLVYRYQVEIDDADANGISVDEGGWDTGFVGWVPTIVASSSLSPVDRYFPGVADDPSHKVDGSLQGAVGMGPRRGDGGPVRTTVADDTRPNDRKCAMSSETVGGLGTLWAVGRGIRWGWQRLVARWRSDDGMLGADYAIGCWVLGLPLSHRLMG